MKTNKPGLLSGKGGSQSKGASKPLGALKPKGDAITKGGGGVSTKGSMKFGTGQPSRKNGRGR